MANLIYLTLQGKQQGLISRGCGTLDSIGNRYQSGKQDAIFVTELNFSISRAQNLSHQPIEFTKLIDKSSPLLLIAVSNNETLNLVFDYYRTAQNGGIEKYFTVKLNEASIIDYTHQCPNNILRNDIEPEERLTIKYRDITTAQIMAGTSGYSISNDSVF
ncbi:Hcp family type VI secretion system effector [Providencia manganoxydans]|uniref:Hcp family type VI secretion system effector n=2 Tax=Providencia TaxID=586 RepID=A0AAI9DCV4_PROST|nr:MULTISPECIES: Hcp family type VI secretion system effector [Providencia]MDV5226439.1 Hcp family type VI secretion system effector [Providencia rettgeri]ELR5038116.1 Hcp family type VI secretion system effector [Providencia stuartii]ELR5081029.1 Hcp family type VI secretion system effector [Providencia stuartii]ELR5113264.1 Hcp family type VI secretion system effector [Providencia stuartii]MDX4946099.1 Hcp family type VI secretion system effector [Providencia manganoxydans]